MERKKLPSSRKYLDKVVMVQCSKKFLETNFGKWLFKLHIEVNRNNFSYSSLQFPYLPISYQMDLKLLSPICIYNFQALPIRKKGIVRKFYPFFTLPNHWFAQIGTHKHMQFCEKGCISDDCFTTKSRCAKGLKHEFLRQRSELFLIAYARIVQNYFARREL